MSGHVVNAKSDVPILIFTSRAYFARVFSGTIKNRTRYYRTYPNASGRIYPRVVFPAGFRVRKTNRVNPLYACQTRVRTGHRRGGPEEERVVSFGVRTVRTDSALAETSEARRREWRRTAGGAV